MTEGVTTLVFRRSSLRRFAQGVACLAALAAAAAAGEPPEPAKPVPVVVGPIQKSRLFASFEIPGYADDAGVLAKQRAGSLGDKALVAGKAWGGKATVTLIVEKDSPHATAAEWLARFSRGKGETFDVGGVACCDTSTAAGPAPRANFNAICVAGGWCFDLHVSAAARPGETPPVTRETFTAVVKSFRATVLRRGTPSDYPAEVLAVADAAARRAPDTVAWLAAEAKARPADYAPALLHGDALRMAKAPDSDCVAPFAQAVALLAKRPDATRTGLFVRAVAADGLGLALTGSGKAAEAVPHLQRALDAATRLASPLRGRFAYNLACGLARKGDAAKAIDALRLAIEANHESRAAAVRDDDLVSLRALPAFQLLTAPVDETPPRDTAIARIPNSGTWITFRAPGWKDLSDEIPALADQLGPNAVALGSVGDARLFVIAVPDEPHRSSAESRSAVFGDKGMQFDAGEVACLEVAPGTYFGFPVAGGLVLRVALGSGDKPVPRDAFAAIVQSVRVWRLTAGTWAEYPPAVLDCMGGVAARMPTEWRAWLDAESKARPDDWVPCFVFAETCSELRLPAADVIAPYTKALALLDAKKDASRGAVFVRMLCEDNLGGVCAEAGKFADAVLHAQRANDAAASIGSGIHGEIALRLARWQARKGDAAKALTALRTALETQPELRERVAASSDFALLKSDAAFQALVAPPPK